VSGTVATSNVRAASKAARESRCVSTPSSSQQRYEIQTGLMQVTAPGPERRCEKIGYRRRPAPVIGALAGGGEGSGYRCWRRRRGRNRPMSFRRAVKRCVWATAPRSRFTLAMRFTSGSRPTPRGRASRPEVVGTAFHATKLIAILVVQVMDGGYPSGCGPVIGRSDSRLQPRSVGVRVWPDLRRQGARPWLTVRHDTRASRKTIGWLAIRSADSLTAAGCFDAERQLFSSPGSRARQRALCP